jgi:phosphatidylglycerophosphate synthase
LAERFGGCASGEAGQLKSIAGATVDPAVDYVSYVYIIVVRCFLPAKKHVLHNFVGEYVA